MTTNRRVTEFTRPLVDLRAYPEVASIRTDDPRAFVGLSDTAATDAVHVYGSGRRCAVLVGRGAPVLMVAHVDTIQGPVGATLFHGSTMRNPVIDDRLGVCLGLRLFPRLGIDVDLLLTTDEEIGESTAALFRPARQYNWMFSFDRGGEDVVAYQYDCVALRDKLHEAGFTVGIGSSSCIACMESLQIMAFNAGVGMVNYHDPSASCDLAQLERQLARFQRFYHANRNTRLPFKQGKATASSYAGRR